MRTRSWLTVTIGVMLCSALFALPCAAAASNGAIVFFEEHVWKGEAAGDVMLRAQKLSPEGTLLWQGGDGSLAVAPRSGVVEGAAATAADGAGGAVVVFEAEPRRGPNTGDCDLWAQRVSGDGSLLWNDGAKPVMVADSTADERHPVVVADGTGGVIVVYEKHTTVDGREHSVIMAQRLSAGAPSCGPVA